MFMASKSYTHVENNFSGTLPADPLLEVLRLQRSGTVFEFSESSFAVLVSAYTVSAIPKSLHVKPCLPLTSGDGAVACKAFPMILRRFPR